MSEMENDPYFRLQRLYDAARLLVSDKDKQRAELRFDEEMKVAGEFLRGRRQGADASKAVDESGMAPQTGRCLGCEMCKIGARGRPASTDCPRCGHTTCLAAGQKTVPEADVDIHAEVESRMAAVEAAREAADAEREAVDEVQS